MQLDTGLGEHVRDIVVSMDPWVCDDFPNAPRIGGWCQNPAGGIANIHILTAKSTAKYMSERYASSSSMQLVGISENTPAAMIYYPYLLSEPGSIFVMAAHVRQLADYRFGSNGQPSLTSHANLSQWTITDAVAVWHGYRYGVRDVSPPSLKYGFSTLEIFQNRHYDLNELVNNVVQGIGAKDSAHESIKYFEAYWLMPN
jgi:hypothetical protein